MRRPVTLALAVLLAASCSSDPSGDPTTSAGAVDTTTSVVSETTTPSGPVTVTAGGAVVDLGIARVEVPAGALPAGSEITVTPAGEPSHLPESATLMGTGISITSDASPTEPVILEFAIPPGESPA